jgi:hypothetical protein
VRASGWARALSYRIAVPTLIIWGDRDRMILPENATGFQRDIAGSRLRELHFGIAPFADVLQDKEFKLNRSWATAHCLNFAYKSWPVNRFIYPNKGIAAHRRLFRGMQHQTYYASRNWCPSLPLTVKFLRACNIV